jgi:hypothetical protein
MNAEHLRRIRAFFETAVNEACAKIKPEAAPVFYCESLVEFIGGDGIKYVVEVTVRPAAD